MIELIERNGYIFQIDKSRPFLRFKGGSTPKIKDPEPVAAVPMVQNEAEDFAAKEQRNKSGFSKTILTGNLVPTSTGKKKVLG